MNRKFGIIFSSVLTLFALAAVFVWTPRSRAQRPQADIKITYKMTIQGMPNATESTTMIKGVRERSEMKMGYGMDQITITQCDLRRTIQLSDKTRKYIITPMDSGEASSTGGGSTRPASGGPSQKGGVVTYIMSSNDTGERKEMFGYTARHVRTVMRVESSPDACNQQKQHIEQDGWYIDLNFGLNCEVGHPQMMNRPSPGGCQDRFNYRHEGAGRTGYPLIETTTIYGPDDKPTSSITKEVTELSRQPLDAALFDIPAGYAEARSSQELMGTPDVSAMMAQAMAQSRQQSQTSENTASQSTASTESKRPGTIRIGVIQINNKTDHSVSTDSLRERLIGAIQGSNVEAVPLNAISVSEADDEAKTKQCDYILATDITALKTSTAKKLGGMFGRATGVGSGGVDKTESKVEFKLFPVGSNAPSLQSSASAKEEGDEASAGAALDAEAKAVGSAVRKRG
jgi:hypothetical protein